MKLSKRDELKVRVANVKPLLPDGIRATIYEKFPKYDNAKGASKLNNVLTLVTADLELTEILEKIAAEYQEELNNLTEQAS
jgi:hypothetical protein